MLTDLELLILEARVELAEAEGRHEHCPSTENGTLVESAWRRLDSLLELVPRPRAAPQ